MLVTILEFPTPPGREKLPQNNRETYVLVLRTLVHHLNPSLFCTDFTSHENIRSEHPPLVYRKGYIVPNDQMFFISVFEEKWNAIAYQYEKVTNYKWPLPNCEHSFGHAVILKVGVRLHSYQGRIEGTLRSFELVKSTTEPDEHLKLLFDRMFAALPESFFAGTDARLIPEKYWPRLAKAKAEGYESLDSLRHIDRGNVETPHIESPHIETPHIESPHIETPHIETPNIEKALHIDDRRKRRQRERIISLPLDPIIKISHSQTQLRVGDAIKREVVVERSGMVPDTLVSDCYDSDSSEDILELEEESNQPTLNVSNLNMNGTDLDINGTSLNINRTNLDIYGTNLDVNGTSLNMNGTNLDINGTSLDLHNGTPRTSHLKNNDLRNIHKSKTLLNLNKFSTSSSFPHKKLFSISAYLVGSIPFDWNYICTKSYTFDTQRGKCVISDPQPRGLELVFSDTLDPLLTKENSLTVWIPPEDLLDFFGMEHTEQMYTDLREYNTRWEKQEKKKLLFEVYGEKVNGVFRWRRHNLQVDKVLEG